MDSKYAWYALGLSFFVPVNFTIKHFLIKKFKGSYDYYHLPLDSLIIESIVFIFFIIPHSYFYEFEVEKMLTFGAICGCLMGSGRVFIAYAVAEGQGGPAQSVMST